MLPLVLVDAEDPDPVQPGRILIGQLPAGRQGQLVDLVPADTQRPGTGCHAHPVGRHALEDPAGHSAGYGLSIVGRLWDRRPEDRDLTVVVAAGQSGYTDVQEAGVADDGQVREPAFDMVTDLAGMPAARAVEVEAHRVAIQVGDVPGDDKSVE
jgi:hypothetical protein